MKIENIFLASLLTKLRHKAKAELKIDDSNGTSLTFPGIDEIAEIAEGVSTDAPDVKSATDSDIAVICVDCAAVRYHLLANMNACMACNTTQ